jgi:uncharacterized membrane protein YhaH (DUF805 family)
MVKIFSFDGALTRLGYVGITLGAAIVTTWSVAISLILIGLGVNVSDLIVEGAGWILLLLSIGIFIWTIAGATVRRCFDTNVSKWWTLALFIPYGGWIVWLILCFLPTHTRNVETA